MKKIKLEEVMDIISKSGYFGFRGLSGIYGAAEYKEDQYLEYSINDWDNRGVEYSPELEKLNGTSAIGISGITMWEEEVEEAYYKALNYSDCGKVILISGSESEYGYDDGEIVLSNCGNGAKFLGEVIL